MGLLELLMAHSCMQSESLATVGALLSTLMYDVSKSGMTIRLLKNVKFIPRNVAMFTGCLWCDMWQWGLLLSAVDIVIISTLQSLPPGSWRLQWFAITFFLANQEHYFGHYGRLTGNKRLLLPLVAACKIKQLWQRFKNLFRTVAGYNETCNKSVENTDTDRDSSQRVTTK